MKGVILAAGSGVRLSSHHGQRPKVLLKVAGRPIIDHTLESFGRVGVTDIAIVIGYRGEFIREWVGDGGHHGLNVQYVYNHNFLLGNASSVYAAREFTGPAPFILSMGDHMVSSDLLARLLDPPVDSNALAVDYVISPRHVEEATRVRVEQDRRITDIGKQLTDWNGVDAGVFRLTPEVYHSIAKDMVEASSEYQLSSALTRMIAHGPPLYACDISGCFWYDVDTSDDLQHVRSTLAGEESWTSPMMG